MARVKMDDWRTPEPHPARGMAILKQISVRGGDTERMVANMHLVRQVHGEMNKPHDPPPPEKKGALTE